MRKIRRIEPSVSQIKPRKKVAAYARISMETERMLHSLSAQVSYYNELIQKNPEWEFAGVYADNSISGTRADKRSEFQRLLEDCEAGKINIILTKSISRFARNTVDLLETVRHLKELGIEVRFEKENISSLSEDGELMMTLLASFAQEEVTSISENVKWIRRKNFKNGRPQARFHVFGYRWEGYDLVVEPQEAEAVREIFRRYMNGDPIRSILDWLKESGIKSSQGRWMTSSSLDHMLTNPLYKGDLVLQKSYVADPIRHYRKMNRGELPVYKVEQNHAAIIDPATFDKVQEFRKSRKDEFFFINNKGKRSCFTSKIKCGCCGGNYWKITYHRPTKKDYAYWWCQTKHKKADLCPSKGVPEPTLRTICCDVLNIDEFDEGIFTEQIRDIVVREDASLLFHFKDGTETVREWKYSAKELGWIEKRRKEESANEECHGHTCDDKPEDQGCD